MSSGDYLRIMRRYWLLVVAFVLLGVLAAAAATLTMRPTYTAKTQLFVAIQNSGSVTELQQGNTFSQARVKSYVETAKTPAVLQPVIDSLGLDLTPSELAEKIQPSVDLNTVLITISASDPSPVQAAALAQAAGASLVDVVETLESPSNGQPSPVKLSVVTPAVAPVNPSSPDIRVNLILGAMIGLAAGVALALARTLMDNKIRGIDDLGRTSDLPLLGGVSYDIDATKKPLVTQVSGHSPRAESFRQIRTNLKFAHISSSSKTVLVTSSLPGEGKSTTAINMAIAMAQSGLRVALVDADLRRPTVANYLGLERNAGLTTALLSRANVQDLLQPWGEDELYVLTSGEVPPNPSELLGSSRMSQLIDELEAGFDAVIVDTPPLIPVTDAAVLAQKVGGVVMVLGAGKVRRRDVETSLMSLELVGVTPLGIVMNLLPTNGPDAYAYTQYSYESIPGSRGKENSRHSPRANQRHLNRKVRERGLSFDDAR